MKKLPLWKLISFSVLLACLCFLVISCMPGSKKEEALAALCENLRSSYSGELSFVIRTGGENIEGSARLSRDGTVSTLEILSPEPYSDLCIEYDVSGAPSSVAVHFSGIDTTLPTAALSRINSIACLCADDYLVLLADVPKENIAEITDSDGELYCVTFPYGNADTSLTFDSASGLPLSLEYTDENISASVAFTKFKLDISQLQ